MGGSSLGAEAIYSFLNRKIRKRFSFVNNIDLSRNKNNKINQLNIIISKSGNTLETLTNLNYQKVKKNCLFITENKNSYLLKLFILPCLSCPGELQIKMFRLTSVIRS